MYDLKTIYSAPCYAHYISCLKCSTCRSGYTTFSHMDGWGIFDALNAISGKQSCSGANTL